MQLSETSWSCFVMNRRAGTRYSRRLSNYVMLLQVIDGHGGLVTYQVDKCIDRRIIGMSVVNVNVSVLLHSNICIPRVGGVKGCDRGWWGCDEMGPDTLGMGTHYSPNVDHETS